MENQEEEEIAKRWTAKQQEQKSGTALQSNVRAIERVEELVELQLPAKRRMIAAAPELVVDLEGEDEEKKKKTTGRKRKGRIEQ